MEERVVRVLNYFYYGIMIFSLIVLTLMYYAYAQGWYQPVDKLSTLGEILQYFVIFDALITIPGGLYGFKILTDKLRGMEDKDLQMSTYRKYAIWRILIVSNAMPLGIIAFYLLGAYRSMICVAAIAAIAWYFTKPTLAKMEIELAPKDPNEETY